MRLLGVDPVRGEEQFLSLARAELPWMREILDPAYAHPDYRVAEHRVLAAHNQVAYPREHQAARDHAPLHLRDGRLGDIAPSSAHPKVDFLLARHHSFLALGAEAAP